MSHDKALYWSREAALMLHDNPEMKYRDIIKSIKQRAGFRKAN